MTHLPFFLFYILPFCITAQQLTPTEQEALVNFTVTDYAMLPEEDALVSVKGMDTIIERQGSTDVEGKISFLLPEGKSYQVSVAKFGEDFNFTKPLALPKVAGAIKFDHKLKIRVITEYVKTYTLDHVYFDNNKWDLKSGAMPDLQHLLEALRESKQMKVEIAGHTDNVGEPHANTLLSQKRADEVMCFLIKNGISKNRILAKGYGESAPIADNATEAGKQKNRRTEVRVISE